MGAYLVRRVLLGLLSIWAISIVAFTIVQLPPGDFIDYYVAQMSDDGFYPSQEELDALTQIHRRDDYAAAERAIGAREGDGPGTIWGRGGPVSVFSCRGETL